jgi:hypothetical protein
MHTYECLGFEIENKEIKYSELNGSKYFEIPGQYDRLKFAVREVPYHWKNV